MFIRMHDATVSLKIQLYTKFVIAERINMRQALFVVLYAQINIYLQQMWMTPVKPTKLAILDCILVNSFN